MASINSDTSKLYVLNAKGTVFALKNGNCLDQLNSAMEIKRVAFACQSRDVLYGIASDLKVYAWVGKPDVPITNKVEVYENERWTPTRGYSDLMLPTDRYNWSDETGKFHRPKDQVSVPSTEHWEWEGTNWEIDENFEGQLLGPDGWTYAIDFPATYSSVKHWNSMARRRRWIRTCRYRSTNRWAHLAYCDGSENDLAFLDISAGGCDISYPDGLINLSLWAISVQGHAYVRLGCQRSTAFHGMQWMRVDLPGGVELQQISCGPAEGVWAITSTGWALARTDISRDSQYGSGWLTVEPPANTVLAQVSVGPDSVWAVGKNGSVWFRQGVKKNSVEGSGWIGIPNFTASCLTVSSNGEVFAIGAADQQLYWRSGLGLEDPHGRLWKKILLSRKTNEGICGQSDPWIWINATAGFLDSRSASWDGDEDWKDNVVEQLSGRFSKEMQHFTSLNRAISRTGWKNSTVLKVWSGKHSDWEDCKVEVGSEADDDETTQFTVQGTTIHISMPISDLTAVQRHEDDQGTQELWIHTAFFTRAATPLKMSGSRKDMEQWMDFLTECYWRELAVKDLSHVDRLWILAPVTGCPSVSHEVPSDLLPSTKWVTLAGHFQSIESASGITWALGHDNSIWIWVGCYPDKSGTERRIQTDTCTVDLYENQRWNPMAGFSSTLLPSDRHAWSDETGRTSLSKEAFQLPSGSWRWDTEWQVDYHQSDEDGWRYSFDFPAAYHPQKSATDYVRRRRWHRTMKVESAAPWLPGPATKLRSVSICPGVKAGENIPLWGVTVDGSVVLRDRVTTNSPQGDSWIPVRNPIPFLEISVGPFCVWATASDGTAYVRNGTKSKMDGLYWFQVEKPTPTESLKSVTVGGTVVWALSQNDVLYFRSNFSAAFPEGTQWCEVTGDVVGISANLRDDLYAVLSLPGQSLPVLAKRTGLRYDDKMGNGWEYGIFAKDVSARGLNA